MAKRLMVKVGSYTKDGQEKGEYAKVGVILENQNGEYALLDPTVNMAGIMMKQRINGISKPDSDSVIASIFTDEPRQQGRQQAPQGQQGQQQAPQQQGGFDDRPF